VTTSKNKRQRKKTRNASNKQKPRQNKTMTVVAQRATHFSLSMCSRDYLRAISDPFSLPLGTLPCIPDLYDSPSKKLRIVQRGLLQAPGSGQPTGYCGFVCFDPFNGISNDFNTVGYSAATYVDDGFPSTYGDTGCLETPMTQSPYTHNAFGTANGKLQYRVVAAGVRVRYAGTELERGGLTIPFRHPQNFPFNGYSLTDVLSFQDSRRLPVDRKWHGQFYLPTTAAYYTYTTGTGSQPDPCTSGSIGVLIKSGGSNSTTWEWECVAFYEVAGATENTTPSHADLNGMSAVRTLFEGGFDGDPSTSMYQEAVRRISRLSTNDISGFAAGAATAAKTIGWI
jgi:hypothetical protein